MNRRLVSLALLFTLSLSGLSLMEAFGDTPPINLLLGWSDDTDDEFGFIIERGPTPDGPWTMAGMSSPNKPEFLDRNLGPLTPYYYRVRSFGERGVSEASNVAKFTTPSRALPPFIKKQPVAKTVLLGEEAALSAEISGNPPFKYQWRRNGTNLPGAISPALPMKSVRTEDAGTYSLVVSNSLGVATTIPAKLTVLAPVSVGTSDTGKIITITNGQRLEIGKKYSIAAVPKTGNAFLGWRINGTNGPAVRSLSFTMQPGLEFAASFRDITPPLVFSKNLPNGSRLNGATLQLTGSASDNMGVARVFYQINGNPWLAANGTTNWQAQLAFKPGANTIRFFAADNSGNVSRTNTLAITSLATNSFQVEPPMISGFRFANGAAKISFQSFSGTLYGLEFQDASFASAWTSIESARVIGDSRVLELTDPAPPDDSRFYRISASSIR